MIRNTGNADLDLKLSEEVKDNECFKCIVTGCPNQKGEGRFVGDLCGPCYESISCHGHISAIDQTNFIQRIPWLKNLIEDKNIIIECFKTTLREMVK